MISKPKWFVKIITWSGENPGKVAGIVGGLVIFLIFNILGPVWLLFLLLVGGGFVIGKSIDDNISIKSMLFKWMDFKQNKDWHQEKDDEDDDINEQ